MLDKKSFSRIGMILGGFAFALLTLSVTGATAAPVDGGTLDPTMVPKYVTPLVIPPVMPYDSIMRDGGGSGKGAKGNNRSVVYYEIEVVQFDQQILPPTYPQTTVWSYGAVGHPETRNYPAFTVEADTNRPVRVKWINNLVQDPDACAASNNPAMDPACNFLPHLLTGTVDQTVHWANPPQVCADDSTRTDCTGTDQDPYAGPVPIVTHVHGAHVQPDSDGYPEAWWLPGANNIPAGYATEGALFDQFDRTNTDPGTAVFQYPNDMRAATLWYHDHTLGMTRLNVYAGPAGFWLLRDGIEKGLNLPGPAPKLNDKPGKKTYFEIPIVIQDRSFNDDGSLFYPNDREFFEGLLDPGINTDLQIPFAPDSDVLSIWNPEAFFNTMVVNGGTWPIQEVEPAKYRFRLLNGCNSRFLILKIAADPLTRPGMPVTDFIQIGADGGLLPAPAPASEILMAPAERADVIVDFSAFAPGTTLYMINEGPDEPFGGGRAPADFDFSDPGTSGQVMAFQVVPLKKAMDNPIPAVLDPVAPLTTTLPVRTLSLNEEESQQVCVCANADEEFAIPIKDVPCLGDPALVCPVDFQEIVPFGPTAALLGTYDPVDGPIGRLWAEAITENPGLNSTEIWEIWNFTADAHPIHLHLVQFQVVGREPIGGGVSVAGSNAPLPGETGEKDTVISYPGEITRVIANFDLEGLYVWHCHIVEHEDNEMMRPYYVGDPCLSPVPVEGAVCP